jgi:hypothetical protein
MGRTPLLEWLQNIDGTNRSARQLEASMPLNTVMPIDFGMAPARRAFLSRSIGNSL